MTTSATTGPSVLVAEAHRRPADPLLDRFRSAPAAVIGDAQERLWVLDSGICAMWAGAACLGPALTVYTRAGDNVAIHRALELAQPGDVLVVNGQGDESRALLGAVLATRAADAGLAGVVVDGAVRDVAELAAIGFPVFARGSTPAGPYKNGPAEIGFPVACGGVVCCAGDIVRADADGVVVVPLSRAEQVADAVDAVIRHERELARPWSQSI
jgi:RraA family protein